MEAGLNRFWPAFQRSVWAAVLDRLGLAPLGVEQDAALVQEVFNFLNETQMPIRAVLLRLRGGDGGRALRSPVADHYRGAAFETLAGLIGAPSAGGERRSRSSVFLRGERRGRC